MHAIRIKPTRVDQAVADRIAANTRPPAEAAARFLTWGADEKVLLAAAGAAWIYAAWKPRLRPVASHVLAVSLASAVLPHLLKRLVNQTRPDRLTVRGHWHGVRVSGARDDAFPSGHALHMGALASAAGVFPKATRRPFRVLAVALSVTRIVVLAHWISDVVVGFALGAVLERGMRRFTLGGGSREGGGP